MAFKNYNQIPTFFDHERKLTFGTSLTQKLLEEADSNVNRAPIYVLITEHYPVGQLKYDNKAYPPLILPKAVPLKKLFGVTSETKLEKQINVYLSFKDILGLTFKEPASRIIRLSPGFVPVSDLCSLSSFMPTYNTVRCEGIVYRVVYGRWSPSGEIGLPSLQ